MLNSIDVTVMMYGLCKFAWIYISAEMSDTQLFERDILWPSLIEGKSEMAFYTPFNETLLPKKRIFIN